MITVDAAEQVFVREDGGCSSLLWIDHPMQPLIFLLHDYQYWHGWPDLWDMLVSGFVAIAGAERGFGYLIQRAELAIGNAVRSEQSYRVDLEEQEDGWLLTDSYGRLLHLISQPEMHWHVV